jgi:tetratricopeptide (TPR) repeat protein
LPPASLSDSLEFVVSFVALWALLGHAEECSSLLQTARREYEQKNYQSAVAQFEHAHGVCGQPRTTLLPLAQAQLMTQRFEASLRSLEALLGQDPKNTDALKLKGDVLYLLAREQDAEKSLKAAIAIDPVHEGAQYALGRIFYQQNRFPEAIELFRGLIQTNPGNYRAHDNLALCYAAIQRDNEAVRHFTMALALVQKDHPEYDTVYGNTARFFLDRGDFQKAFQFGAEAAKRNPGSARNFFITGKALVQLGKLDLSVRWLRQAAELDPSYTEPHYWLASVYRKLGRKEEANKELEAFRQLSSKQGAKR